MKSSKRGVTPVIATIILIAGTLVLALVVGAYTFGLFGSNVKTVTL
ncbi:MAG: archaellin/type IV pilin N-terminal domain-containing protein, partial [Rhabdochlamydiaceae bacterium]